MCRRFESQQPAITHTVVAIPASEIEQKGKQGMNIDRFENLTRRLVKGGGSRRSLLRWAGVLGLPGLLALGSLAARAAQAAAQRGIAPS